MIFLILNPRKLMDPQSTCGDIMRCDQPHSINKLPALFHNVLQGSCFPNRLTDYLMTRVDLCVNVWAEKNSVVREYLRLQRKRKTPAKSQCTPYFDAQLSKSENRSHALDYYRLTQKGQDLVFYDKSKQAKRYHLAGAEELPKGLLRIELQLKRKKLCEIERKQHCDSAVTLLRWLISHCATLLIDQMEQWFSAGAFVRKDVLNHTILVSEYSKTAQMHMIQYAQYAKTYGEDIASARIIKKHGWTDRQFKELRRKFEVLGIQPIPLRKNIRTERLEAPEACLQSLLEGSWEG